MRSRTVPLPPGSCPEGTLRAAAASEGRDPDLVLGFLPSDEHLPGTLRTLARTWPESLRFGCEAVTQFADAAVTRSGSLQLFWFELPGHGARIEVVSGTRDEPPGEAAVAEPARPPGRAGRALLLAAG